MARGNMGRVLTTAAVDNAIATDPGFARFTAECLARFQAQDWGELSDNDRATNRRAEKSGSQVLASYPLPPALAHHQQPDDSQPDLWIIKTSGHKTGPTVLKVLFPGEYWPTLQGGNGHLDGERRGGRGGGHVDHLWGRCGPPGRSPPVFGRWWPPRALWGRCGRSRAIPAELVACLGTLLGPPRAQT